MTAKCVMDALAANKKLDLHPYLHFLSPMLIKIQKGLLRLVLLMLLIALLLSLPSFVESALEDSLRLEKWRSTLVERARENSGLRLSVQGIYINLFQGIVLKGLRLEDEEGSYRFYTEDLHVNLAFFPLLKGRLEKQSLYAKGAKLHISSFNSESIQKVKNSLLKLPMLFEKREDQLDLPVFLSDLRLIPFKRQSNSFLIPFDLELSWQSLESPALRKQKEENKKMEGIEIRMYPRKNRESLAESEKEADWELKVKQKNREELQIELDQVPVKILALLLQYYGWEEGTSFVRKNLHLERGLFSGEALYKTRASKEREFSFAMSYKDLGLSMRAGFFPSFHIRKAEGKLELRLLSPAPSVNEKAKDTAFRLKLEQPGLALEFSKEFSKKRAQKEDMPYHLNGNMSFDPQPQMREGVALGLGKAKLAFALSLHKKDSYSYPLGYLKMRNLNLDFLERQSKNKTHRKPVDSVFIKKISIHKKSREEKMKLRGIARLFGSKLKLSAESDLRFLSYADTFRWESDWDVKLNLSKLSLASFLKRVQDTNRYIERKGKEIFIRKGLGLKRNEFMRGALYRNFLSNLRLKAQIALHDIEAAAPIPRQLHFKASANSSSFRLELVPLRENENFWADFRYALYFQGSLPKHDIDLRLSLNENKNPLLLLGSAKFPPKKLDMEYRYDGYGLMATDVLRRSYSYLQVKAEKLKLADKRILRALAHHSRPSHLKSKSRLFFDTFSLRKASNGIDVKLYFTGHSPELRMNGSGFYKLGLGGNLQCSVQEREASKQHSKMRILASGQWVPEIN